MTGSVPIQRSRGPSENLFFPSRSLLYRAILALLSVLLGSCATPTSSEIEVSGKIIPDPIGTVVLLPMSQMSENDERITHCVEEEFKTSVARDERFIDRQVFRNALFPWFEVGFAPKNLNEVHEIMRQPTVRDRMASLGVRYLVYIGNHDAESNVFPGLFCGAGYGGAGCLGVYAEHTETSIRSFVWDVAQFSQIGELEATSSGVTVIPGVILPFPFIAYTEDNACEELAAGLRKFFGDENAEKKFAE